MLEVSSQIPSAANSINLSLGGINPCCEMIAVIPVYKEYKYGRVVELLDELSLQTIGRERFETILVINNPSYRETPSDEEGYIDNLELLDFLDKGRSQGKFANVRVVNCTNGELPKRHIGMVRGLGNEIAHLRLSQSDAGQEGLIIQLDADASLDPDFLWQLKQGFSLTPSAQSATIPINPLPTDCTSEGLFVENAKQFVRMATNLMEGKNPGCTGGPTLSFKSYIHEYADVKRYMRHPFNEDYQLGDDLCRSSRFMFLSEPRVLVADRRRPEGFDANLRCCLSDIRVPSSLIDNFLGALQKKSERISIPLRKVKGLDDLSTLDLRDILDDFATRNGIQAQKDTKYYLQREEVIAERRLNGTKADQQLTKKGVMLFALGRLAFGKSQTLRAYPG